MNKEKLNARDLLVIASSQWASAKDIMVIGSVGRNKAYAIRNEIIADYYDGDQRVRNRRLVPLTKNNKSIKDLELLQKQVNENKLIEQ